MKVTEYFVGFGPRLWSFRRGETEYGIKALPLGGYVKIPGMTNLEEVDPADEGRLYRDKPFHSRLLVAVAGSAVHFLLAFVLLWVLLAFVGVPNGSQVQIQGLNPVGGRASPAAVGGIRAGDVVVSVDGKADRRERPGPDLGHPRPSRSAGDRGGGPGRVRADPDRDPGQRPGRATRRTRSPRRAPPPSASSGSAWARPCRPAPRSGR